MSANDRLTTASGLTVISDGPQFEEEDSALSFSEYHSGNQLLGYIMRSPSGLKYSMKTMEADAMFTNYSTYGQAEAALLAAL